MGDASTVKPELCQVWSVRLEGVDIRSSCLRHVAPENSQEGVPGAVPGNNTPGGGSRIVVESISSDSSGTATESAQGTGPGAVPGVVPGVVPSAAVGSNAAVGSSLLRNTPQFSSSPPGDVTVEVNTPLSLCA